MCKTPTLIQAIQAYTISAVVVMIISCWRRSVCVTATRPVIQFNFFVVRVRPLLSPRSHQWSICCWRQVRAPRPATPCTHARVARVAPRSLACSATQGVSLQHAAVGADGGGPTPSEFGAFWRRTMRHTTRPAPAGGDDDGDVHWSWGRPPPSPAVASHRPDGPAGLRCQHVRRRPTLTFDHLPGGTGRSSAVKKSVAERAG